MRQVRYASFGESDVLEMVDTKRPVPGGNEVLIRVAGAGLNPIDWKTRKGLGFVARQIENRLPFVPGFEVAGTVEQVGPDVSERMPGDRVMGLVGFPGGGGGYADYALARAEDLAIVPEELDLMSAGAVPLAALTAWQALFEVAELEAGQKVLVLAGAGGVGHFAVQFALERGAHVIATASGRNRDFLAELGVHEFIDYHTTDVAEECYGLDLVLDLVGGEPGRHALKTLGDQGVMVTVPTVTADEIISHAETLGLRAHGMTMRPDAYQLDGIAELIEDGDVRVHIERVLPLEQAAEGHRLLEEGHVRGKLVLDCS